MNLLFAVLTLLFPVAPARAGQASVTIFNSVEEVQPWLTLSVDPRAAAMAGAVVASTGDVQSLRNNPAGLNLIEDPQIVFNHNELDSTLGIRQEYLGAGRMTPVGGIAGSISYFSYGSFDNLDSNGVSLGSSTDQAVAGTLGYGTGFFDNQLSLGLNIEASQESLGSSVSTLYDCSLGALYEVIPGLNLGMQLGHVGLSVQEGDAPTELDLGAAWQPWFDRNLTFAGQWDKPNLSNASVGVGAEWKVLGDYALRAGWRFGQGDADDVDQGFSAGAGANFGPFQFDYAYVPEGTLASTQRIAITIDLSEGLFGGNIVIEGMGVTQNAEAEYGEGKAAYDQGDWYVAKVSLSRVLKIMPQFDQADQVKLMLADIEKKIFADRSRGMNAEQKKKIDDRLAQARTFLANGDLAQARSAVEAVLEFDSDIKDAVDLRKKIDVQVSIRVAGLMQTGIGALSGGDLQTAVKNYREVLHIDDDNADAMTMLRKLSPRIHDEVKSLHRKGIDLYVGSDIQGAIALWEKALELDPSDPNFIRRDVEKAKKLLELRSVKE